MRKVPVSYFQKYFLVGGLACVAVVAWVVSNIYDHSLLKQMEPEIAPHFKTFKIYETPKKLPSIRVAGPSGEIENLKDNGGQFTILNVWATWCAPCVKELASFKKLDNLLTYDKGWRIVAVSIDSLENLPKVAQFTAQYDIVSFAGYNDVNFELQNAISVKKLPMTLILTPSNKVLYEIYGEAFWHEPQVLEFLKRVRDVYSFP